MARNPFIKVNLEAARAASQILVFITVTGLAGKLLLPSQNILELFLGFFVVLLFVLFLKLLLFNALIVSFHFWYQVEKKMGAPTEKLGLQVKCFSAQK